MGNRKYPRIGHVRKMGGKSPCKAKGCAETTDLRLDIQVNWFRGDDEVVNLCPKCVALAKDGKWDHIFQQAPEAA